VLQVDWKRFSPPYRDTFLAHDYNEAYQKSEYLIFVDHDVDFTPFVLERMKFHIEQEPNKVHVGPYLLYPLSTRLPSPVWHMRRFSWADKGMNSVWGELSWDTCDSFAFGFTYIPKHEWEQLYLQIESMRWQRVADCYGFERWHSGKYEPAKIEWDCVVCHTHV